MKGPWAGAGGGGGGGGGRTITGAGRLRLNKRAQMVIQHLFLFGFDYKQPEPWSMGDFALAHACEITKRVISRGGTNMNQQATVQTEQIAEDIRSHMVQVHDWQFNNAAIRLNRLYDDLNAMFFQNCLPMVAISIGPDLITRYGYYQANRDAIGTRHRIHLNSRHFGRADSDVAVTLLHEMLHMHQHLFGTIGRRTRYHNREFVAMARIVGIDSNLGNGVTVSVSGALRSALAEVGFGPKASLWPGADDTPITKPQRKASWRCTCGQVVWADRGLNVEAVCSVCHGPFETPAHDGTIDGKAVPAPFAGLDIPVAA